MNNDIVPGIIPNGTGFEPLNWVPLKHKGKTFPCVCMKGEPLRFQTIGQIPKKILRKMEKKWRALNPAPKQFQFQYPQITSRYNLLALGGWLREKMGAA